MSFIYYQNCNILDFQSQNTTSISSISFNNNISNQKASNKLLKQKRGRNKNDKHEYEDLFNQYYSEDDFFDCYNNDFYDYSQKSSSDYHKEEINFDKLKNDLMPKEKNKINW